MRRSREMRTLRRNEKTLVRRMLAGDETAFEEFIDGYAPILYRFAQRRLDGNGDLARDIVQSTLCKVITKLSSFRGEAALTTWLCACCRNEIAVYFRQRNRPLREAEQISEDVAASAALNPVIVEDPEEGLLRRESDHLVHVALDSLPPHYGKALEWKYLDRLPVVEIARRLELGPKAAESLLTRARQAFRKGYASPAVTAEKSANVETIRRRTVVLS